MSVKAIPIEFIGLRLVKCPLLNKSNDYPQQFILDIVYSHSVFLSFCHEPFIILPYFRVMYPCYLCGLTKQSLDQFIGKVTCVSR